MAEACEWTHLLETSREKLEMVSPAFFREVLPNKSVKSVSSTDIDFQFGVGTCFYQRLLQSTGVVEDGIFGSAGHKEAR